MFKKDGKRSCFAQHLWFVFLIVTLTTVLTLNCTPESSAEGEGVSDQKILAQICHEHKPCEIIKKQDAGLDQWGQELKVVTLSPCKKNQIKAQVDSLGGLEPLEYWLIVISGKQIVSVQPLFRVINDEYGAAGGDENDIAVGDNWFELSQSGGSNWRSSTRTRLQLSPLRIVLEETQDFYNIGSNTETESWDWNEFSGYKSWYSPACGPDGQPVEDFEDTAEYSYSFIPRITLNRSFTEYNWKTIGLGKCAVLISGLNGHGYTIYGKPGSASDASFKALLSTNNELFVEVFDDHWVGPSAKWVYDDHLELWLGEELPSYTEHCIDVTKLSRPKQWCIRISDGKVFPAYGNPKSLLQLEYDATPLNSRSSVRLKIKLPDTKSLTMVYSDTDDGKTQERLIATSKLLYGSALTLGELREIKPDEVIGEVRDGLLEPRVNLHKFDPLQPVLGN